VIAHPATIKKLAAFQPWPDANISAVTIAAASAALKDQAFVKDCKEKIAQTRELCYKTFKQLSLEYIPSHANFILFNIDKVAGDFTKRMEEKNIFVQFRNHFGGKWCRVSMGTIDEMKAFCTAIKKLPELLHSGEPFSSVANNFSERPRYCSKYKDQRNEQ
jgi:histidinol-phosphate aminotransferase